MPSYIATHSDTLSIHTVGVDAISVKTLELYLAPKGHHIDSEMSPESYLEHVDAFRCDLLILGSKTFHAVAKELADIYENTHADLPRASILSPGEAQNGAHAPAKPLRFVLQAPLKSDDVLRIVNNILHNRAPAGHTDNDRVKAAAVSPKADAEGDTGPAPSSGANDASALNGFHALIEETGLDGEMVQELTSSFMERGEAFLKTLEQGIKNENIAELHSTCHAMKGMVANMRFPAMHRSCEKLEHACKSNDKQSASQSLSAIKMQFERIVEQLKAT